MIEHRAWMWRSIPSVGRSAGKGDPWLGVSAGCFGKTLAELSGTDQKYWYDANGNQIKRIVGPDTYDLVYDAENRLSQVKKNSTVIATFTYDADGNRVKSVMGSETTVFIGGHYEVTNPGLGQMIR